MQRDQKYCCRALHCTATNHAHYLATSKKILFKIFRKRGAVIALRIKGLHCNINNANENISCGFMIRPKGLTTTRLLAIERVSNSRQSNDNGCIGACFFPGVHPEKIEGNLITGVIVGELKPLGYCQLLLQKLKKWQSSYFRKVDLQIKGSHLCLELKIITLKKRTLQKEAFIRNESLLVLTKVLRLWI